MKARVLKSVVVATAVLSLLTSCDLFAPQDTLYIKETSDGVSGSTGKVFVGNAVIVTTTGKVGNLVATLVNKDYLPHPVQIQHDVSSESVKLTLDPAASLQLGTPGNTVVLITNLNATPGSLVPVYFQSGINPGVLLNVPVLTGAQPQYSDLTPEKIAARALKITTTG
ncbi:hypothetical protein G3T36_08145 [Diaminobutyricibacter tongyongensis]|uniref:DNA modification methylase n=1 Tax=Leifsonia tongyongensis TaxID=1268043 RepID=A0A6L9XWN5_9MICO|nr:hypothetical protein [Diaminobutyricibacter tongyongensis]NEN05842.1 hypothetical protein [Diaminobutyricibacter tongyongensis]